MLHTAFNFLKKYLEATAQFDGVSIETKYLPSKNIDPIDEGNKIYITLLSIEEERNSKMPYQYERNTTTNPNTFQLLNPTLILNLYIMFSASGDYIEALKNISKVITVFANKFAFGGAEINEFIGNDDDKNKLEQLCLDIQNISLDQSNNLWQALANSILPHIIYKARSVAIVPTLPQGMTTEVSSKGVKIGANPAEKEKIIAKNGEADMQS